MVENKLFNSKGTFSFDKISSKLRKPIEENNIDIADLDLSLPLLNIVKKIKKEDLGSTTVSRPSLEARVSALEEAVTDIILTQMEV